MSKKERTLFIVRHAHRDTSIRSLDNGLSDKGLKQALAVSQYLSALCSSTKNIQLRSSPKVRCQETIAPLGQLLNVTVEVDALLDEQSDQETSREFLERIQHFEVEWKRSNSNTTVICTHGDWIPEFSSLVLGQKINLPRGGLIEARLITNRPVLFDLKPHFDVQ